MQFPLTDFEMAGRQANLTLWNTQSTAPNTTSTSGSLYKPTASEALLSMATRPVRQRREWFDRDVG